MDLDAYFARISYSGDRAPTLAVLRAIAERHPAAIAFENIAVVAGGVPELSLAAVTAKLVRSGRGGYCYEQNTLLQAVLVALGFNVTALAARVRFRLPADYVMARSHMILRVGLPEGQYLVDAGFGGLTLTAPLRLVWDEVQTTPHEDLRFIQVGGDHRLQARISGEWADVYQFDMSPQLPPDFVTMNWHTATRPNALFRDNLIVTRAVAGGRYSLFNQALTWRPLAGEAVRQAIAGAAALRAVLEDVFATAVPDAEIEAAAEVAARAQGLNPSFG